MSKFAVFAPSPEKINISGIDFDDGVCPKVTVSDVKDKCVFDILDIDVKVCSVGEIDVLGDGSVKQDLIVADSGDVCRATVWGDHVGTVKAGCCYLFSSFMVKEFSGSKYLSMRKGMSAIKLIADIGVVKEDEACVIEKEREIKNVNVSGVAQFSKDKMCQQCKGAVEPDGATDLGRCSRSDCRMLQAYAMCPTRLFARLMFLDQGDRVTLAAYGKVLRDLARVTDDEEVTETALLCIPRLERVQFDARDVITGFKFKDEETPV